MTEKAFPYRALSVVIGNQAVIMIALRHLVNDGRDGSEDLINDLNKAIRNIDNYMDLLLDMAKSEESP